jgi:hypothetical protein
MPECLQMVSRILKEMYRSRQFSVRLDVSGGAWSERAGDLNFFMIIYQSVTSRQFIFAGI